MYTVFCLKIYTPRPIKITPIVFYTLNFKKHNFSSTKKNPKLFSLFLKHYCKNCYWFKLKSKSSLVEGKSLSRNAHTCVYTLKVLYAH